MTKKREIRIRPVRRDPPDLKKLARALIELAMSEIESEAPESTDSTDVDSSGPDEAVA